MKRTRVLKAVVLMVLVCSGVSSAALFQCSRNLNLIWEAIGTWRIWDGNAWVNATRMPNANDDVLISGAAPGTFWTHDGNPDNDPLYIRTYTQQGYLSDKPASRAYCNTLRIADRPNTPRGLQIDGSLTANAVHLGYVSGADPRYGGTDTAAYTATVNIHCTEEAYANVQIGSLINDNAVSGTTFLWTQYGGTVSVGSIVLNTSLLSYQLRGGTLTLTGSISGGTGLRLNVAGGTLVMPGSGFTSLVQHGTVLQADGAAVHSGNVQDLLDVDTTTSPGNVIVRLLRPRQAHDPVPADGAVDVDVTHTVSWSAGREALSYDVYGGTRPAAVAGARRLAGDINGDCFVTLDDLVLLADQWLSSPSDVLYSADIVFSGKVDIEDFAALAETWHQTPDPEFMGNQTSTTYVPVLEHDTTYYWRVDAVNPFHPDSPWFGPLWNFTTRSATDWVDRKRFPEAYSILTSDHVMYPDNVTDFTLKIDGRRQLFVDDYVIAAMENLVREFHQPVKYAGNPLPSLSGKPAAVLRDEATGTFRMWYDLHYAESQDGIHWTKPDVAGGGDNRILDDDGQIRGFMYNPDIPEQEGRYKLVLEKESDAQTGEPGGFYLYHSLDGLIWQRDPDGPVLQPTVNHMVSYTPEPAAVADGRVFQETDPDHFQARGMEDGSVFQYDPVLKKYTCSSRFDLYMPQQTLDQLGWVSDGTPRMRMRTFLESDDFVHWSSPRVVMFPDKFDPPDCQIYGHMGFPYESMWLGLVRTLRVAPAGFKQVDLGLAYSRTGRDWLRPYGRVPFLPRGGTESWEADYLGYTKFPPMEVGDEVWFYYYGARHIERDNADAWEFDIGLATLRRDGFVSLNAGLPGKVTTRPLTFTGTKLFVNASVQSGGWVKAAVLTRNWEPVGAYGLADSVALTNDALSGRMVWQSSDVLPSPGTTHLRLVFELRNAKLYSFWIE